MKTPDVDQLIQEVLDGEAAPAAAARLEQIAERSEETRREIESMRRLFDDLRRAGETEVPPELKAAVLRELASRRSARSAEVRPFPGRSFGRRAVFAAAWAAAAVIAIVLVYPMVRPDPGQPGNVSGAMVGRPAEWTEVARAATPDGSLAVTVRRAGDRLSVEPVLERGELVRVTWSGGIAPVDAPAGALEVTIPCPGGRCGPAAFVRIRGRAAALTLTGPGGEVLEIDIP